ncbi:hypothetical protein [Enterococcus faecalis]|uniref:hypothetical protein n=1 Tax=Enterococcus faecalis TaxID=1351 RepID=UPI0008939294|nr:hypothetical protein [Enterococcus faecalis]MCU9783499.1 hypothetical protein [Enterococcus faecalis]OFA14591.1 hypothetical protein ENFAE_02140 [Enterococcus faecalis]
MKKKYPFIIIFYEQSVYGYFPDINNIIIEADLVSTCLELAKKKLMNELKRYKVENRALPIANHISYYVCKKNIYYVTNITINL